MPKLHSSTRFLTMLLALPAAALGVRSLDAGLVDYPSEIQPIFTASCGQVACHIGGAASGIELTTFETAVAGVGDPGCDEAFQRGERCAHGLLAQQSGCRVVRAEVGREALVEPDRAPPDPGEDEQDTHSAERPDEDARPGHIGDRHRRTLSSSGRRPIRSMS